MLGNSEVVQHLTKGYFVDVVIDKQILCYLAKLNMYTVIIGDRWLHMYNPAIDWKDRMIKFNSADCMEKKCLLNGKPYVEFAVGCKLKHKIGPNKFNTGGDINIQQVSAKHFFQMTQKKDHKGYRGVKQ